jgi:hypothetical protein
MARLGEVSVQICSGRDTHNPRARFKPAVTPAKVGAYWSILLTKKAPYGSGVSLQPVSDRSFMFAQTRIACAECREHGIGSTTVVGATPSWMTGSERRSLKVAYRE